MGRADGAGDAWKVGPAYADGVDIGFADDGMPADWAPVKGGVLWSLRAMAGEVMTFLDLLLRGFCFDPVSGAVGFVLLWEEC
jgi:hypothetical protein